jgi:hypothetical protein
MEDWLDETPKLSRTCCMYCKTEHEWFARNAMICEPGTEVRAA